MKRGLMVLFLSESLILAVREENCMERHLVLCAAVLRHHSHHRERERGNLEEQNEDKENVNTGQVSQQMQTHTEDRGVCVCVCVSSLWADTGSNEDDQTKQSPHTHKRAVGEVRSEERRGGKECRSRWAPYN